MSGGRPATNCVLASCVVLIGVLVINAGLLGVEVLPRNDAATILGDKRVWRDAGSGRTRPGELLLDVLYGVPGRLAGLTGLELPPWWR